jgi:hypothetical protein
MKATAPPEARAETTGATTGPVPGRTDGVRRWIRTHPGLVVLLLVPLLVFGVPQLFGWTFADGDNFLQNLPMRVLVGRDLRHGVLPLWNPYLFSGTPLLGGFNAGAAYPTTWLMAVLPTFAAWWLNLALAYDIAIVGTYLFLRRQGVGSTAATFAAAAFAFAGYMTAQIVHIDLISGAAWLPWMVMAVHALTPGRPPGPAPVRHDPGASARRRGWVALLAVSVGLTILSGGAEAIIDSAVLVAVYTIGRLIEAGGFRPDRRRAGLGSVAAVAVGTAGGVALGAAQWIPGAAFAAQSQRATTTYTFFTSGSLPYRALTLIASPFVLGANEGHPGNYAGPYNFPEVTSYVGVLALIAVCSLGLRRYRTRPEARHWWIWYVILGVGILTALGGQTPFGHVMYLIPVVSDERLLSRNLLLVDFSLAILLGWWMHLLMEGRAEAISASPGQGTRPPKSPRRPRWQKGERTEIIVTCLPLAFMVAACLFLWIDGPSLYRLLAAQVAVTATTREHVAALVTAGVVIAAAATAIVLGRQRLSVRQLRRWLAAVMTIDLVLFNCFVIRLPVTEATALAVGPLSTAFHAQVGEGRFIIYDPDEFYTDQLYALGQTDLNIYARVPSAQGYTALSSGVYFAGTGAHYQEDLNPADLSGPVWDDLNVTTLLSLPSYFVTQVGQSVAGAGHLPTPAHEGEFVEPAPPTSFALAPATVHQWYFGGAFTVRSITVPLMGGTSRPPRIGVLTASGGRQWLPPTDTSVTDVGGHRTLRVSLPTPVRAAGVLATPAGGGAAMVGVPEVLSSPWGTVALDGRLQEDVAGPHWRFTGTLGSFGAFRNVHTLGWAWITAPGGGPAGPGSAVTAQATTESGSQRILVRTTGAAALQRSQSWSTGWRATIQRVAPGSGAPLGPSASVPVTQSGVIQKVALPGAGLYQVSFTYAAGSALLGVALSALATVGLAVWAVTEMMARRRRSRGRQPAGGP